MNKESSKSRRKSTPGTKPKPRLYETSPTKTSRRTGEQMLDVLRAIQTILDGEERQITIRHLFYRLVGLRIIPKEESAYKSLCGHLSKWRRSKDIPWSAFTDSTRWHIHQRAFDSIEEALEDVATSYRRNLWSTQPCYIEVWVEKDAIAALVARSANAFGVPVFVARGFASLSSLYDAANIFRTAVEAGKRPIIYHLGDYDPSGVAAGESVLRAFRDDFKVDLEFIRAAVTQDQIQQLNLPTRPVKTTDRRAAKWTGGECVELDTMPPAEIRKLVESCITGHIDRREWETLQHTEAMERETLQQIRRNAA